MSARPRQELSHHEQAQMVVTIGEHLVPQLFKLELLH